MTQGACSPLQQKVSMVNGKRNPSQQQQKVSLNIARKEKIFLPKLFQKKSREYIYKSVTF